MGQAQAIENSKKLHYALREYGIDFPLVNKGGVCFGLSLKYLMDCELKKHIHKQQTAQSSTNKLQAEAMPRDVFSASFQFLESPPETIDGLIREIKNRFNIYKDLQRILQKTANTSDIQFSAEIANIKENNKKLENILAKVTSRESLQKIVNAAHPVNFSFLDEFGAKLTLNNLIDALKAANDYYENKKKSIIDPRTKQSIKELYGEFKIFGFELENCQAIICKKDKIQYYLDFFAEDCITNKVTSIELAVLKNDFEGHSLALSIEDDNPDKYNFTVYDANANTNKTFASSELNLAKKGIEGYADAKSEYAIFALNALSYKNDFKNIIQDLIAYLSDKNQNNFSLLKIKNLLQAYQHGKISCFDLASILLNDKSTLAYLLEKNNSEELKNIIKNLKSYYDKQNLTQVLCNNHILAADKEIKNQWLILAILFNKIEQTKLLIQNGAQPNTRNFTDDVNSQIRAPLVIAIRANNTEMVKELLKYGAHPQFEGAVDVDSIEYAKFYKLESYLPFLYAFIPYTKEEVNKFKISSHFDSNQSTTENLAHIFSEFAQAQKTKRFFQDPNWHIAEEIAACLKSENNDAYLFDILFWAMEKLPYNIKQNSSLMNILRFATSIARENVTLELKQEKKSNINAVL